MWDFLKYCYMGFRPSPFVLRCVRYLLESESQTNIIWGGEIEKASNFVLVQCHSLNYQMLIP